MATINDLEVIEDESMASDPDWQKIKADSLAKCGTPVLERIEWRLMYGMYGTPTFVQWFACIISALLALILWRVW